MGRTPRFVVALAALAPAAAALAGGTVHEITQVNFTWSPDVVTVSPGDTVRWIRTASAHTVTSGSSCTPDGLWFDVPLNGVTPIFEWVVPSGTPSEIPFFCTPHCAFGMTGTIIVEAADCFGDLDGSGDRGFGDLLQLLSSWGACVGCPEDLDASGAVDFNDLLQLLAAWGPC